MAKDVIYEDDPVRLAPRSARRIENFQAKYKVCLTLSNPFLWIPLQTNIRKVDGV